MLMECLVCLLFTNQTPSKIFYFFFLFLQNSMLKEVNPVKLLFIIFNNFNNVLNTFFIQQSKIAASASKYLPNFKKNIKRIFDLRYFFFVFILNNKKKSLRRNSKTSSKKNQITKTKKKHSPSCLAFILCCFYFCLVLANLFLVVCFFFSCCLMLVNLQTRERIDVKFSVANDLNWNFRTFLYLGFFFTVS